MASDKMERTLCFKAIASLLMTASDHCQSDKMKKALCFSIWFRIAVPSNRSQSDFTLPMLDFSMRAGNEKVYLNFLCLFAPWWNVRKNIVRQRQSWPTTGVSASTTGWGPWRESVRKGPASLSGLKNKHDLTCWRPQGTITCLGVRKEEEERDQWPQSSNQSLFADKCNIYKEDAKYKNQPAGEGQSPGDYKPPTQKPLVDSLPHPLTLTSQRTEPPSPREKLTAPC